MNVNKTIIRVAVAYLIIITVGLVALITSKHVNANSESESNSVYMICDVYDVVYNGKQVEVDLVLPNGELLTQMMSIDDDLPDEFTEVVIEATDLDDYSTYNIVGLR